METPPSPAYAHEAHALLSTLTTLAADVHLRALVYKTKCDELERALQYIDSLHARRQAVRDVQQSRATQADTQTQQVHESIEDAIQRARQVREALTKKSTSADSSSSCDSEHECDDADTEAAPHASDAHLQSILAMAKSIRAHAPAATTAGSALAASTPTKPLAALTVSESAPAQAPLQQQQPIRIEYPRRMKALVNQLEDATARIEHESFRATFCRKMTEHMALRPLDAQTPAASKVQVGFATQALRLEHAHKYLAAFLSERIDTTSDKVTAALAPDATVATIFPVFTRLQQVGWPSDRQTD